MEEHQAWKKFQGETGAPDDCRDAFYRMLRDEAETEQKRVKRLSYAAAVETAAEGGV